MPRLRRLLRNLLSAERKDCEPSSSSLNALARAGDALDLQYLDTPTLRLQSIGNETTEPPRNGREFQ